MVRRALGRREDGNLPGCARRLDAEVEAYGDGTLPHGGRDSRGKEVPSNVAIERKCPEVSPLPLGVIGHEGSTIIVVLNGLRLLRNPS